MNENSVSKLKFINLHAHSVAGSIFDALDYPPAHMEFAYSNGMNAMAFTDHGNMNFLPYAILHAKKMKAEGKDFKPIFGCEAYFVPSITEWRKEYERVLTNKKEASKAAEDETSGTTIENEAETKKASSNVLNRRRHLVLLAQNQTGLNNLFKLVSDSYREENYYRYPRIDYDMLRKHSEGIIASSACITADALIDSSVGRIRMDELVERVLAGEEIRVLSYNESTRTLSHQKVLWADLTRKNATVVKIKLKDGKELRLTPDHKVFTDRGWMEAGELSKHKGIKILSLS